MTDVVHPLRELEYKIIVPFRLHLRNIERFSLVEKGSNLFIDRKEPISKLHLFRKIRDELNSIILNSDEEKAGNEFNRWRIVKFQEVTPDILDSNNLSNIDNSFIAVSLMKNRENFFKATFCQNQGNQALVKHYGLDKIFEAFKESKLNKKETKGKSSPKGRLNSIDIWFYDWNVGGVDFNFDIKVDHENCERELFQKLVNNILNEVKSSYCLDYEKRNPFDKENLKFDLQSDPKSFHQKLVSDLKGKDQKFYLSNLLNTLAREIIRQCNLKPTKRSQTEPISYSKILLGHLSTITAQIDSSPQQGIFSRKEFLSWLIDGDFQKDTKNYSTDQVLYLEESIDPTLILGDQGNAKPIIRKSKVVWLWRISTFYWASLEWLNVLFAKQLDEIGILYHAKRNKSPWKRFFTRQSAKDKKTLDKLVKDSHHTRNRLIRIMRELSVTNIYDHEFDRDIYLSLRKHFYLDPLENEVLKLTNSIIDEQRKFRDDLRDKRVGKIQYLIVINIILGICATGLDHVFIKREYIWPFSNKKKVSIENVIIGREWKIPSDSIKGTTLNFPVNKDTITLAPSEE